MQVCQIRRERFPTITVELNRLPYILLSAYRPFFSLLFRKLCPWNCRRALPTLLLLPFTIHIIHYGFFSALTMCTLHSQSANPSPACRKSAGSNLFLSWWIWPNGNEHHSKYCYIEKEEADGEREREQEKTADNKEVVKRRSNDGEQWAKKNGKRKISRAQCHHIIDYRTIWNHFKFIYHERDTLKPKRLIIANTTSDWLTDGVWAKYNFQNGNKTHWESVKWKFSGDVEHVGRRHTTNIEKQRTKTTVSRLRLRCDAMGRW